MTDRRLTAALRPAATAVAYVGAYVALDWLSYIHPMAQLAITPWNPPPGLSLFLLLRCGLRYTPALFVAALLSDLAVRGAPLFSLGTLLGSFLIASGYAAIGWILAGPLAVGQRLRNVRDVSCLVAAAVIGPLLVALAYVGLQVAVGAIPGTDTTDAIMQFWIGDAIGIVVTTPLLLEFAGRRAAWRPGFDLELASQAAAVLLALWIVFGVAATDEFKFFYLLFLPVIWIAMRRGLSGAVVASLVMQLGLIAAEDNMAARGILLRELQFLMLTLALTALYLGMSVSEREEAKRTAAARDAALNRALRMATAGELAATIAHELNQPLSAIGTYARACVLMADGRAPADLLPETLGKITREVARAGEVNRRLRDFYRSGSTHRERTAPAALVDAVVESLAARLAQNGIEIQIDRAADLPAIDVDRVQMQMVLHNLFVNAIEALGEGPASGRRIRVSLGRQSAAMLACEIADSGPGISAEVAGRLFEPFTSTKSEGMGFGLAMSRSIVEAHGGTLGLAQASGRGATFQLVLPVAKEHGDDDSL